MDNRVHLVALLAVSASLMSCAAETTLAGHIKQFGFAELEAPSTLVAPGTIVYIRDADPLSIGVACNRRAAYGDSIEVLTSPTKSLQVSHTLTRRFALGGDIRRILRADARLNKVKNVWLGLSNDTIYAVSLDVLEAHKEQRAARCKKVVADLESTGWSFAVIVQALKADVTYTVDWADTLTIGGSTDSTLRLLALTLGMERASVGTSTISGTGLFWGVVDESLFTPRKSDTASGEVPGHRFQQEHPDHPSIGDTTSAPRKAEEGRAAAESRTRHLRLIPAGRRISAVDTTAVPRP